MAWASLTRVAPYLDSLASVFGRRADAVDDDDVHWRTRRIEPQAKLLTDRRLQRWRVGVDWLSVDRHRAAVRQIAEVDVVSSGQLRPIVDGPLQFAREQRDKRVENDV